MVGHHRVILHRLAEGGRKRENVAIERVLGARLAKAGKHATLHCHGKLAPPGHGTWVRGTPSEAWPL